MTKDEIKAFRQAVGLNCSKIAKVFRVKPEAWYQWESGKRRVPAYIEQSIRCFCAFSEERRKNSMILRAFPKPRESY